MSKHAALAVPRRFKPYPAYKDCGVEWLKEIPAHWELKRLKFVAPARINKLNHKPEDAVYVGLEHIESWTGRLQLDNQPESVDSVVASFSAGDILFGKLRPYLAKAARPDFDGVCTSEILPLRPTAECFQNYVMYSLLNAPYIRWLDSLTCGAKMPRVSPEQVGSSFMPIPSIVEQRVIAAFLDRETAKIDALVAKKERLIELLEEKRTALITRAVTKGLDPTVPMKDSGVEWLGEIPAHWDVSRITRVARMESGHTPDKKVESYWKDGDIPWVSLADTERLRGADYITETGAFTTIQGIMNSSARVLPPGAVAFSRDASIGLCGILGRPMAVSQHFIAWVCTDLLSPDYLLLVLRTMTAELDRLTMGATVKTIGMPDVKILVTPLPPREEQRRIVDFVGEQRARIDALLERIRQAIDYVVEYRTALISAAVTGKIDVREEVAAG